MKYSLKLGQLNSSADISSKMSELSPSELADKLNAQIGAFDDIIDFGSRYKGIYVVKIVKATKHPDADKLQVCLIDDGGSAKKADRDKDGFVQVVCGGPNAREGLITTWVSPGATVPSSFDDKEPFVLSKIKLRGVESSGMLATAKELGLSNDHEGVIELEAHDVKKELLKPGTPFSRLFDLDDIIVDFENKMFTHRPDCFGHLGIAREIAGIQGINFKSPEWYKNYQPDFPKPETDLKLEVDNRIPELVPRYTAVCIEDIKIAPSPMWLKAYLTRLGIRPINNVVDVTNYMMILTGQPMHAFDFDKVKQQNNPKVARLIIRHPKKGDKLTVLQGKDLELNESTITIYKDDLPIDLAGINGGANSEIDEKTTKIILQSASFDMYAVRRASMHYGIFTDAVTRYTKGQSTAQTAAVLFKAMQMLGDLIPSSKFGQVFDFQKKEFEHDHLVLEIDKINKILGTQLSQTQVVKLLESVEISSHEMLDEVCVTPPFWRTDLEIDEDIIEEIGRLYGFNKIDAQLPIRRISPAYKNALVELKKAIRDSLSTFGANEALTYNFVSENLIRRAGQDPEMAFKIRNALSPELQRYRLSLVPNLLDKVHSNIKAGEDEFALFELGKAHIKGHLEKKAKLPTEYQRLGFVYANKNRPSGSAYFYAKRYLQELLDTLGVEFSVVELKDEMFSSKYPISAPFMPGRTAGIEIEGELRGLIGEFSEEVCRNFKLPETTSGFELDLGHLSEHFSLDRKYSPLNKFPKVSQDITITSSSSTPYFNTFSDLQKKIELKAKPTGIVFKISPVSIFQPEGEKSKRTTFNIEFWHRERTLTSDEVNKIMG